MRVMALDVGFKRIGVAISDPLGLTASPYTIIHRKSNRETFKELLRIIDEKGVGKIVVGISVNREGKVTQIGHKIKKFASKLEEFLKEEGRNVEITFWDEAYSTKEAQEIARSLGKRKEELDDYAAALILREFLEQLQSKEQ